MIAIKHCEKKQPSPKARSVYSLSPRNISLCLEDHIKTSPFRIQVAIRTSLAIITRFLSLKYSSDNLSRELRYCLAGIWVDEI